MFYGKVVTAGKPLPLVPHPDGYSLHLSQASLPASLPKGSRLSLLIKVADEEPVVLCTLCAGAQDTVLLDQFLDEYAELSVAGNDSIHITGYYSPQFGGEAESEEEGEDYEDDEYGVHPMHTAFGESSSSDEGDSDDEDESDDEYATDDEDEDMSDDVFAVHRKEPSVIIEDITDKDKEPTGQQQLKALPAPVDSKKRKAEAAAGASTKKQALDKQQLQNGQQQQQPKQQPQEKPAKLQQPQKDQKHQAKPAQQQVKQEQQQQKSKQKEQKQQQAADSTDGKADGVAAAQPVSSKKGVRRYENGFEVHSVKMGDPHGKLAKAGKQVKVKYVGKLKKTGQVFDKSQGKPFGFRLGVGEVIKGWDAGVEGMRVGDVRKLVIPPQMAYGSQRTGPIPPNSTLEFEVQLVDVK